MGAGLHSPRDEDCKLATRADVAEPALALFDRIEPSFSEYARARFRSLAGSRVATFASFNMSFSSVVFMCSYALCSAGCERNITTRKGRFVEYGAPENSSGSCEELNHAVQ